MITTKEYLEAYKDSMQSVPQDIHSEETVVEYNKELVKKYPWLVPGYVGFLEPEESYDYEDTWADDIPSGWRLAFGDQMIEELDQLLKKYGVEDYGIYQIKEKWGILRWYDNGFPEEGYKEYSKWLRRYENLSEHTCIFCGEPAKYLTEGWIAPICKACVEKEGYSESSLTLLDSPEESTTNREDNTDEHNHK